MSKHTHTNPITGLTIKAENVDALDAAMQARQFKEPKWATFQQWKGTGAPVRPREVGVTLTGASGFKWRVFNIAQTATKGAAEAPRASAATAPRPPAAAAAKPQPSPRAPKSSVVPSVARSATAVKAGTVTVDAIALREALEWTRRAVGTEVTRSFLHGVYFCTTTTGDLQLVATDGHRMHGQSIAAKWTGGKVGPGFIMKPDTIRDLVKEIGGKPRAVAITVKGADIAALTIKVHGGKTFATKALDGTFPDFERVIPQDRLAPFSLQARAVFEAADLAADGAKPGKATKSKRAAAASVAVALDAAGVHLKATAAPYAYFNAKYLRDMARMGDVLEVEFTKSKPHDNPACIFAPQAKRWGVLMPMRGDAPAIKPAAPVEAVEAEPVAVEPVTAEPVEAAAVLAEAEPAPVDAVDVVEAEPVTVETAPAVVAPRRTFREWLRAIFRRR